MWYLENGEELRGWCQLRVHLARLGLNYNFFHYSWKAKCCSTVLSFAHLDLYVCKCLCLKHFWRYLRISSLHSGRLLHLLWYNDNHIVWIVRASKISSNVSAGRHTVTIFIDDYCLLGVVILENIFVYQQFGLKQFFLQHLA